MLKLGAMCFSPASVTNTLALHTGCTGFDCRIGHKNITGGCYKASLKIVRAKLLWFSGGILVESEDFEFGYSWVLVRVLEMHMNRRISYPRKAVSKTPFLYESVYGMKILALICRRYAGSAILNSEI